MIGKIFVTFAAIAALVAGYSPGSSEYNAEIVTAHNGYRQGVGDPDLTWDSTVQSGAQQYADTLAVGNLFQHSGVSDLGENLWMGPADATPSNMVGAWGSEAQYFFYAIFPDCSTTGNWMDVGHYTQIIWRNTLTVGCGGALGSDGNYRFVCRYSPPGNYMGEMVY